MNDNGYEFDYGFLEMETLSPLEFAHLAAGVEIEFDSDEAETRDEEDGPQGESFHRLPGCWLDPQTRTAANIRKTIDGLFRRTQLAEEQGQVITLSPREWIEWGLSRKIEPGWLDAAYRDPAMHRYLPERQREQGVPESAEGVATAAIVSALGTNLAKGKDEVWLADTLADSLRRTHLRAARDEEGKWDPVAVAGWLVTRGYISRTMALRSIRSNFHLFYDRAETELPQPNRFPRP